MLIPRETKDPSPGPAEISAGSKPSHPDQSGPCHVSVGSLLRIFGFQDMTIVTELAQVSTHQETLFMRSDRSGPSGRYPGSKPSLSSTHVLVLHSALGVLGRWISNREGVPC